MNLRMCQKLTGMFGLGWGMVGGVKIGNRLRPQGLTLIGDLSRNLLYSSSITLPHAPTPFVAPGNIAVLEGMQIKELNLAWWV